MVENRRPVGGLEWSNNPPPGGAAEYFDETPFMRSVWDQRAGTWISEGARRLKDAYANWNPAPVDHHQFWGGVGTVARSLGEGLARQLSEATSIDPNYDLSSPVNRRAREAATRLVIQNMITGSALPGHGGTAVLGSTARPRGQVTPAVKYPEGSVPPAHRPSEPISTNLPQYPPREYPEWRVDKKKPMTIDTREGYAQSIIQGSRAGEPKRLADYLAKVNSPEALEIQRLSALAQKQIDLGNYKPMFDVSKRFDVDPSPYNLTGSTRAYHEAYLPLERGPRLPERIRSSKTESARPAKPETAETYRIKASNPEGIARLENAFQEGLKIPNANNWYYMGQLEKAFVKRLGKKKGREAFREKFAKPMAATTGGAAPKENLRTAMYGNYLKKHGIPYPLHAYDMHFPAGGQFASGSMAMHKKLMHEGAISDVTHPKRHNFEKNFLGDADAATIDKQMSQLFNPTLAEPQKGAYGAYEDVVGYLAKKYNVSPREFQEVAWAGAKKAREGTKYPGSKPMIQEVNEAIERTSQITGMSPEDVLNLGIMDSSIPIYSRGGLPLGLGSQQQQPPPVKYGGSLESILRGESYL
jgi:hypothetical protein